METVREALYIDGRWAPPSGDGHIDLISPADGAWAGRVPAGCEADVDRAVAAASRAFEDWSRTSPAERSEWLSRIRAGLKQRGETLAHTITREMGAPIEFSRRVQVGSPLGLLSSFARLVAAFDFESRVGHSRVLREPVGVVAAITPWNYPLRQVIAKVGAALAAGCTVVLKPSELTPGDAFLLADVVEEVGLPAGVFNLVTGTGPVVGEAMARHPGVDMVSFTGSTRAGRRVSELAAATVKRVSLELGGKSAGIVLDGADFDRAVPAVVQACMLNGGQTCSALTRLLVPSSRYALAADLAASAVRSLRLGDPMDAQTDVGPMASHGQQSRVLDYIRRGREAGAKVLAGGDGPPAGVDPAGAFVLPTLMGEVAQDNVIAREEIFGPVLVLIPFHDEADAIRIANDSPYGLSGGVWAADDPAAERVARRLRTGQVAINGGLFNIEAPFGGYKQSGNGREQGLPGIEEFLEYKALQFRQT
ncbi:MAG: aldehyde dehydrogenase family protein [Rhodocyclaceae bacterium]|nr:aldehyde dehydrogenase family protein [Rhodocyclaceae bacterium]